MELFDIRSFYRQIKKDGDAVWLKLNQKDPAEQEWYYRSIAASLADLREYDVTIHSLSKTHS